MEAHKIFLLAWPFAVIHIFFAVLAQRQLRVGQWVENNWRFLFSLGVYQPKVGQFIVDSIKFRNTDADNPIDILT